MMCHTQLLQSCSTVCIPWTCVAFQAPPSMGFSWPEYWNGLPFPRPADLLQGIFLMQESNQSLRWLLHCRWILYRWANRKTKEQWGMTVRHRSLPEAVPLAMSWIWPLKQVRILMDYNSLNKSGSYGFLM